MTVFIVLCNACASANDYTVSYAFEGHDLHDAAQAGCDVAPACELSLDKWNLVVRLVFFDPTHQRVNISVHEKHGQSGCCYLADAAESVNRDVDSPISLYVFPGHAQPEPNTYRMRRLAFFIFYWWTCRKCILQSS